MNQLSTRVAVLLTALVLSLASWAALAQTYAAETPEAVLTPDVVETQRLGTLRFFDGMPDEDTDIGVTGPDQGRGGRYLFLPPDYDGPVPSAGFHVIPTRTNMHWLFARAFVSEAGVEAAVAGVKAGVKVYLLSEAEDPPEETFVNFSGSVMNTIHANDVTYFDELNAIVQNEPADAFDP